MTRARTLAAIFLAAGSAVPGFSQATSSNPAVTLPPGTKVELVVTRPVWAKTAKPGDTLYAQTDFPVTAGQSLAIPAGTWVQGTIETIARPTRRSSRAKLDILFSQIIFADGTAIALPGTWPVASPAVPPTAAEITVDVSTRNDLLLDNGAQMEMTLATPVTLNPEDIAKSIPLTRAPAPGSFQSATLCRPTQGTPGFPGTPGTPGTPDTVIPGTPDIDIPGGPGMPDTVIPGTPPTVIPGTPGTPGTPDTPGTPGTTCPSPPVVVSSVPLVATPPGPGAAGSR